MIFTTFMDMEKLLALKKIGLQQIVSEDDGLDVFMAYTDDLLKKNLLIEYYGVVTADTEEDFEEETAVSIITYDKERCYSFILFAEPSFMKPMQVYRIIVDAIEFIESCDKESVLSDIEDICTGFSTSDDISDRKDRKRYYELEKRKFDTAMELIRQKGK
jgi:hypothetical protein